MSGTRNSLLFSARQYSKELEQKLEKYKESNLQLRWEVKTKKERLLELEAKMVAERHDFHKRQLEWLGIMEETTLRRKEEAAKAWEDVEVSAETLTGARLIIAPISDVPFVSKSKGKDVICMRAISKMDTIECEPWFCELGSPKDLRAKGLPIEEVREALR